jgi:hypothetical protein
MKKLIKIALFSVLGMTMLSGTGLYSMFNMYDEKEGIEDKIENMLIDLGKDIEKIDRDSCIKKFLGNFDKNKFRFKKFIGYEASTKHKSCSQIDKIFINKFIPKDLIIIMKAPSYLESVANGDKRNKYAFNPSFYNDSIKESFLQFIQKKGKYLAYLSLQIEKNDNLLAGLKKIIKNNLNLMPNLKAIMIDSEITFR